MLIRIEDAINGKQGHPWHLIRFILNDRHYFQTDRYTYGFWSLWGYMTYNVMGPYRPTKAEMRRATLNSWLDMLWPWRLTPPKDLSELAVKILRTGLLNIDGALNGSVLPVTFVAKNELHVIIDFDVDHDEAERVITAIIAEHFELRVDEVEIEYGPY